MTTCQNLSCRRKATQQAEDGMVLACDACANLQLDYDWEPVDIELIQWDMVSRININGNVYHAVQTGSNVTVCGKLIQEGAMIPIFNRYHEDAWIDRDLACCKPCARKVGQEKLEAMFGLLIRALDYRKQERDTYRNARSKAERQAALAALSQYLGIEIEPKDIGFAFDGGYLHCVYITPDLPLFTHDEFTFKAARVKVSVQLEQIFDEQDATGTRRAWFKKLMEAQAAHEKDTEELG
jgi:hypothetical protein